MWGARYFGARYFGARYFGKRGLVVLGAYNGARYFGKRYFGRRYWGSKADSSPFSLTATNTLAAAAVGNVSGSFAYSAAFNVTQVGAIAGNAVGTLGGSFLPESSDWSLTPPLEIGTAFVTCTITGDLVYAAPAPGIGRYFGPRYFGPHYFARRYWGTLSNFNLAQTAGISGSAVSLVAGGIETAIVIAQTSAIVVNATGTIAGDLTFSAPAALPLGGSGGYWPDYGRPGKKKRKKEEPAEVVEVAADPIEAVAIIEKPVEKPRRVHLIAPLAEAKPMPELDALAEKAKAKKKRKKKAAEILLLL